MRRGQKQPPPGMLRAGAVKQTRFFWVYPKTANAPGQLAFSCCAAPFSLEIRQYSCEKMSCSARKFLAAGRIARFQIPLREQVCGGLILYCVHEHQRQADICGQRGRQQRTNDDADHAQHFFPPETHGGQDDPGDRQKEQ